jgi:AraC-like DNA-binding protein
MAPIRRNTLSLNTSSLSTIQESNFPPIQGPEIPEGIHVLLPDLQHEAIEQQPMAPGEEKIIAKYQKHPDSPVIELVANAVGDAFMRRSPIVISDSSSDSSSALSYTSDPPAEQVAQQTEQPVPANPIVRPIDMAELIEFIKTQEDFNALVSIIRREDQSLLEALLRFQNYYQLHEEVIEVGAAIFHNIQQQKKVEDESRNLHIALEANLEKLADVRQKHSRRMKEAFKDSVNSNLNRHARDFVEAQRKKRSDQLTHSLQNLIDVGARPPYLPQEVPASVTMSDVSSNQPSAYNAPGPVAKATLENLPSGVVRLSTGVSFLPPQPVVNDTGLQTRAGKRHGYARVRVRVHKAVPVYPYG